MNNIPVILNKVETTLANIRPYLKEDGGDVKIVGINKQMILEVELLGACQSCPMSAMTLSAGVEEAIRKSIPEIKGVEAVNVPTAEVV